MGSLESIKAINARASGISLAKLERLARENQFIRPDSIAMDDHEPRVEAPRAQAVEQAVGVVVVGVWQTPAGAK